MSETPMIMMLSDAAENARRTYARAFAHHIAPELLTMETRYVEHWLSAKIAEALQDYEKCLESLVNSYHRQACDALNLKLPEPFIVKNGKETP